DRQIRLAVDLQILDEVQTRIKREKFAENAPLAFVHNPEPIDALEQRLEELLRTVASEPMYERADSVLRADWQLTPEQYSALRQIVPEETAVPGVITKLRRVLEPLRDKGVLKDSEIPTNEHRATPVIEIYPVGDDQPRPV